MKIQITKNKSIDIGGTKSPGGGGIVGLDVETSSIAATEVKGGSKVTRTAIAPLPPGVVNEGEVQDADALSEVLSDLFSQYKLSKTVRLGIANQRVVVRTLHLPLIEDEDELETAVRFQAQEHIPMPLDQAVLDHHVVGKSTGPEGERQMEVVAVAARRDMVTSLLGAMRKAGLRPVGIDLSAFGMIRALHGNDGDGNGNGAAPAEVIGQPDDASGQPDDASGQPEDAPGQYEDAPGEYEDAPAEEAPTAPTAPVLPSDQLVTTTLYCYLGDVTNLAVARGAECLFTRVAPFGMETIASEVAEGREMSADDARDLLLEVGLEESVDFFDEEGASAVAAREALQRGATKLADELRLSLDFYGAQENVPSIERVVVCGPGSTIPGLPQHVQNGLGLGIEPASPDALSDLDPEDAARLTVSYGLALGES
jgi:type IV pilus assembly protein PilM